MEGPEATLVFSVSFAHLQREEMDPLGLGFFLFLFEQALL